MNIFKVKPLAYTLATLPILFGSAAALASAAPGPVPNNSASAEQNGSNNASSISQMNTSGAPNTATISQVGTSNTANATQSGGGLSLTVTTGSGTAPAESTTVRVDQAGEGHTANITQEGVVGVGEPQWFYWLPTHASDYYTADVTVDQSGSAGHSAEVTQTDTRRSTAWVKQTGAGTAADAQITQTGDVSVAIIDQTSSNGTTSASIDQSGAYSNTEIIQAGAGNRNADVTQAGAWNRIKIEQMRGGASATVDQLFGSLYGQVLITQRGGGGKTAKVLQSGIFESIVEIDQQGVTQNADVEQFGTTGGKVWIEQVSFGPGTAFVSRATVKQQDSTDSNVNIDQDGAFSKAIVNQTRTTSASIDILQFGDAYGTDDRGATANVDQIDGLFLNATLTQGSADGNSMNLSTDIDQSGEYNSATVNQLWGEAHLATVDQSGFGTVDRPNRAEITQAGGANYSATIIQMGGAGNNAIVAQSAQ